MMPIGPPRPSPPFCRGRSRWCRPLALLKCNQIRVFEFAPASPNEKSVNLDHADAYTSFERALRNGRAPARRSIRRRRTTAQSPARECARESRRTELDRASGAASASVLARRQRLHLRGRRCSVAGRGQCRAQRQNGTSPRSQRVSSRVRRTMGLSSRPSSR